MNTLHLGALHPLGHEIEEFFLEKLSGNEKLRFWTKDLKEGNTEISVSCPRHKKLITITISDF